MESVTLRKKKKNTTMVESSLVGWMDSRWTLLCFFTLILLIRSESYDTHTLVPSPSAVQVDVGIFTCQMPSVTVEFFCGEIFHEGRLNLTISPSQTVVKKKKGCLSCVPSLE